MWIITPERRLPIVVAERIGRLNCSTNYCQQHNVHRFSNAHSYVCVCVHLLHLYTIVFYNGLIKDLLPNFLRTLVRIGFAFLIFKERRTHSPTHIYKMFPFVGEYE